MRGANAELLLQCRIKLPDVEGGGARGVRRGIHAPIVSNASIGVNSFLYRDEKPFVHDKGRYHSLFTKCPLALTDSTYRPQASLTSKTIYQRATEEARAVSRTFLITSMVDRVTLLSLIVTSEGVLSQNNTEQAEQTDLDLILAALQCDYTKLSPRIRELQHEVSCEYQGVTLRLHFPAFRQGKATIHELVEIAWLHLMPFALTRQEIAKVDALYGKIPAEEFRLKTTQLNAAAASLFVKAHKATNRSGEAGELMLYLLTEWILQAPQVIAKMTLKTNPQMPVHGADGIHVRYCTETSRLFIYWGESKMYADVKAAIVSAAKSIAKSLGQEELDHELQLVQRNIEFTGLDEDGKAALLRFLDPHEEAYNDRKDIITCLIGFDFNGFEKANAKGGDNAEPIFRDLAKEALTDIAPKVSEALKAAGLTGQDIELFLFPLPAVQEFRDLFQAKIGWLP
jgi:hypothetical protein